MEHAISPLDPPTVANSPAVQVTNLVVQYGDTVAVDGLTMTAHPGEIVALLGPNGAGKTSTVETLEGYRRPASGSVRVLGLDPHADHGALVPHIGVMLQRGGVYPMLSVSRVLELFAAYYADPEDPEVLIDTVGLEAVRDTAWRNLSGGEQQRLSLALALVGKPTVIFLDEPTAGVDPEGRLAVRAVIAGLRQRGLCVILTTHELTEAERLADRVIIMHHGRKLAEDSPHALAARVADGAVRFSTSPGLDIVSLGTAVGGGVTEEEPGHYVLAPDPGVVVPQIVAALTAWLAVQNLSVGDLRTGRSLEEAYLAIVGSAGSSEDTGSPGGSRSSAAGKRRGRHGRRRSNSPVDS